MKISMRKVVLPMVVGCAAVLGLATPGFAATVSLNGDLVNGGFDTGSLSPWVAGGNQGAGVYAPTATNYPAPNGLASGFAPSPPDVAYIPGTAGNGAGSVLQTLSLTMAANTTYTLSFFVGLPLVVQTPNCTAGCTNHPDGGTTATAQIGYDNGGSLVQGGLTVTNLSTTFTTANLGQWMVETITATTGSGGAAIGSKIDVQFGATATSIDQPHQVDFDIVTPLPGAAWLFGTALFGGLGLMRRKRQAPATA